MRTIRPFLIGSELVMKPVHELMKLNHGKGRSEVISKVSQYRQHIFKDAHTATFGYAFKKHDVTSNVYLLRPRSLESQACPLVEINQNSGPSFLPISHETNLFKICFYISFPVFLVLYYFCSLRK